MKRLLFILAVTLMIESSKPTEAQGNHVLIFRKPGSTGKYDSAPSLRKNFKTRSENVSPNSMTAFIRSNRMIYEAKITRVHVQAVRDFTRRYKTITDAKWFITEAGYAASFVSKGIFTKIAYNAKGIWLYNLLEYTEGSLSPEIRRTVKREYYDHEILTIHQYEFEHSKTVYIIKMQDEQSNMATIKVFDGEIEDLTPRGKN